MLALAITHKYLNHIRGNPTGVFTSVIEKATFTSSIALPRILAATSLPALLSIDWQAAATIP